MATIGGHVKTIDPMLIRGGRDGGCTTRRKKTFRKQMARYAAALADYLAIRGNSILEAMPWKEGPQDIGQRFDLNDWKYAYRIANEEPS